MVQGLINSLTHGLTHGLIRGLSRLHGFIMSRISYHILTKVLGWKFKDGYSSLGYLTEGRYVVTYPHTCVYEPMIGILCMVALGCNYFATMKHELATIPILRQILGYNGGIGVDRTGKKDAVNTITKTLDSHKHFVFAIAPEGTRTLTSDIKSGFYHIAKGTGADIISFNCDFINNEISVENVASNVMIETSPYQKIRSDVIDNFSTHNVYDHKKAFYVTKKETLR